MIEGSRLPESVLERAVKTCNGEYAWKRSDLESVMQELIDNRFAITSGEIWVVEGNLFCALSPKKSGGWSVLAWKTSEKDTGEQWYRYAQRTLYETLDALGALNAEQEVDPTVLDHMYYHLCCEDERSYLTVREPTNIHHKAVSLAPTANWAVS